MADDHDILIRIETDIKWLKTQFSNHLKHHVIVNVCLLGSALSAITALVIVVLRG